MFLSGGRWIIKNLKKLFVWFVVYSANTLILPVSFIIAIVLTFFVSPTNNGIRAVAVFVTLVCITYMINFNFKLTNMYEKNEGFFYFSANLSRSSVLVLFTLSGLLLVLLFPLIILDNSGINISFYVFYAVLLYVLFYYFLMLAISILFRKPQISMFLVLFIFILPTFLESYLTSKSEILMVNGLTPMSLTNSSMILNWGFFNVLIGYVISAVVFLFTSISIEKWRSFP